jgi:hypothetical protein
MRALALTLALTAVASAAPRLVYSKDFPGSTPAWTGITVERSGEAVYKEAVNDDYPIRFKLTPEEADEIFKLADKLDHFSRPLEAELRVAKMGMKTFRYEDGAKVSETKFNFSLDENAKVLLDWFERMAESAQNYIVFERTVKYDRLGVNDSILRLQASWERKRLVGTGQFLPLLDRVIKNDSYMHIARERAAALADALRGQAPAKTQ